MFPFAINSAPPFIMKAISAASSNFGVAGADAGSGEFCRLNCATFDVDGGAGGARVEGVETDRSSGADGTLRWTGFATPLVAERASSPADTGASPLVAGRAADGSATKLATKLSWSDASGFCSARAEPEKYPTPQMDPKAHAATVNMMPTDHASAASVDSVRVRGGGGGSQSGSSV
jgi:hypothetical protein